MIILLLILNIALSPVTLITQLQQDEEAALLKLKNQLMQRDFIKAVLSSLISFVQKGEELKDEIQNTNSEKNKLLEQLQTLKQRMGTLEQQKQKTPIPRENGTQTALYTPQPVAEASNSDLPVPASVQIQNFALENDNASPQQEEEQITGVVDEGSLMFQIDALRKQIAEKQEQNTQQIV